MRLKIHTPQPNIEGFFRKYQVYQLITKLQLETLGQDYKGKKFVTRSRKKDPLFGIYSKKYAKKKRDFGGDTSRFNLKLTGKYHSSFIQIPSKNEVKIFADTKKGNKDLKKVYPALNRFSNESINKIIRGDKKFLPVSLIDYLRQDILAKIFVRQ
jgi:hypothetical protein